MPLSVPALALLAGSAAAAAVTNPTVTLNNGVEMPLVALGVWQYDNATALDAVTKGLKAGFTHIDTAFNYNNQQGVGQALKGHPRDSFFLTTKTPPCAAGLSPTDCYNQTMEQLQYDLTALQMDHVDLVLIHGSSGDRNSACDQNACDRDFAQWRAYEEFYAAGKAKAIGVSNYCISCLECLYTKDLKVKPTVNQFQFHIGMGSDGAVKELLDECTKRDIVPQAYSPLGNGQLLSDKDIISIAGHYEDKAPAQIALKWIVDQNIAVATKADNYTYIQEDIDLFSWNLTAADKEALDTKSSPDARPSWSCAK